jgi:two-component system CheB/CheR fusion protein
MSNQWLPNVTARADGRPGLPPDFQREADRVSLSHYAPPAVLVDEEFEVQQFRGRTGPFLEVPSGQPTSNLLRMARAGVFAELRSALTEAKVTRAAVVRDHLFVSDAGRDLEFTLRILPITVGTFAQLNLLVLFEPKDWPVWSSAVAGVDDGTWLRQELDASREYLQSMLDVRETANQELRAAHEEVLSSNEELQSTNEELETTKEELQSANEELTTVNEQFQTRNRELDVLTDDLSNFIASADVPMVTVDHNGVIRRLTPAAHRVFNLLATDIGRSIGHIRFFLVVDDIGALIEVVINTGQSIEREVQDREGRWWLLRVRPYLTADTRVDGATLVAMDVDFIKRQHDLMEARDYALSIVRTVREALVVLDPDCRVGLANEAFHALFGESLAEIEGRALWDVGHGIWSDSTLRRLLTSACAGNETIAGVEIDRVLPSKGLRTLVLNARLISRAGRPGLLLLAVDDVTDARQAERLRVDAETLRLVDRRKDEFLGTLAHELRNPLAPMLFAVEMLRRSTGKPAETDRARQVLERQIAHMVRIVDDLLDVSRITQGKVELRKVLLRLSDLVHSAVELSRRCRGSPPSSRIGFLRRPPADPRRRSARDRCKRRRHPCTSRARRPGSSRPCYRPARQFSPP